MNTDKFLYPIPYLLSASLSLGIFLYAWNKRNYRSARELSLFLLGQTLWLFGIIFEMIANDLSIKIFWDKFQWAAGVISLVSLPYFAARLTNYTLRNKPRFSALLAVVPVVFICLLLTDPVHHLLYPDPKLISSFLFSELTYSFTWVVYGFAIYSYFITFCSVVFLIIKSPKSNQLQRMQIAIISIGLLIPILGTVIGLMGIHFLPQRDASPLFTAIGNVVLAWGFFRYHLFEVVPIAHETIVENLDDMVVVLDAFDRVADINKKAIQYFGLSWQHAIGLPGKTLFAKWSGILPKFNPPMNFSSEEYFLVGEEYFHYDVKSTLLNDPSEVYIGRIISIHDVSPYAHLQWELKQLNEHLEERVLEKTRELSESYETTLEGWAKALELRDKETEGHSRRVVEVAVQLASRVGMAEEKIIHLRRGAILHDIGKMAIPDRILRKKGELSPEEWVIVKKHPETAYELLKDIPYLKDAIDIPYCHHEHWDGTGYPRGLRGEEIPLPARIFTIVDVWDALLSNRSYCQAWPREKAIQFILENSGTIFDPVLIMEFLNMMEREVD